MSWSMAESRELMNNFRYWYFFFTYTCWSSTSTHSLLPTFPLGFLPSYKKTTITNMPSFIPQQVDLPTMSSSLPATTDPIHIHDNFFQNIYVTSLKHDSLSNLHPYPLIPNRKPIVLDVALLQQLKRPMLVSRDVWIVQGQPRIYLEERTCISTKLGISTISYIWTDKNGFIVFVCNNGLDEFLLAVPRHWTTLGVSKKRWSRLRIVLKRFLYIFPCLWHRFINCIYTYIM
jgi:hypothetical protein